MVRPTRRISLDQVLGQVSKMRQLAGELNGESTTLHGIINEIVCIWKGEASREFVGQGEGLEEDIRWTSRKISDLADKIEQVARNIDREDNRRIREYEEWQERQEERRRERRERRERVRRSQIAKE